MSKLTELKAEAQTLVKAYNDGTLNDEGKSRLQTIVKDIEAAKNHEAAAKAAEKILDDLDTAAPERKDHEGGEVRAKSIGEHFVKSIDVATLRQDVKRAGEISAPEFKAATDAATIEGLTFETVDQTVIDQVRPNPTIANLMGSGQMSGNVLRYRAEVPAEGAPATVAPGGLKPHVHYRFEEHTESPSKIAGLTDILDEMLEDAPFLVSLIQGYLMQDLVLVEEDQILNGDGTGTNLRGLLNRSGVLAVSDAALVDGIFKATTAIKTASKATADGVVIHPVDYETIRLSKDANGQYLAGGPFYAPYGNGRLTFAPSIWGLRTVVTAAAPLGTPIVGAFGSAMVLRKGGISVAASNQHSDNFAHNRTTLRAEERVGLMVTRPSAFAKVTKTVA